MNARTATIIGSVVLHGVLALAAVLYDGSQKRHRATSVMVMGAEKKKEPVKKEEPPKPPPPKKLAMRTHESIPTVPPPEHPPVKSEATHPTKSNGLPQATGPFTNGGDGPGIPVGPPGSAGKGPPGGDTTPQFKATRKKTTPDEDPCTEAPTKPQPVSRPTEIEYTQRARTEGVEGRLVLKIIVGDDGAVMDVVVVSSVDPSLDAAAIAAVKTWVFKPSQRCGKQMKGGVFMYAHRFELGD